MWPRLTVVSFIYVMGAFFCSAESIRAVQLGDVELERVSQTSPKVRKMILKAQESLSVPYKWGGTSLTKGIDCSNFTWQVCRSIGLPYTRFYSTMVMSRLRGNEGFERVDFEKARTGDLLVYGYRDQNENDRWRGHVVILVDKSGKATGHQGLVLGAHGANIRSVQFVTYDGFEDGYFGNPKMKLVNVLRVKGMGDFL
jgi:cell wall-associated NlpC family hydrolase